MIVACFFTGLISDAGQDFVWNCRTLESALEDPEASFPWSKEALSVTWTTGSAFAILLVAVVFSSRFSAAHPTPSNAFALLSLGLGSGSTTRRRDDDREEAEEEEEEEEEEEAHPCPVEVCPFLLREYFFRQLARDCGFPSTRAEARPLPRVAPVPAGSTECTGAGGLLPWTRLWSLMRSKERRRRH